MTPRRFLADENFPGPAVEALRQLGHDVVWVRTLAPGIPDEAVVALAAQEDRILLTADKDFGALAYTRGTYVQAGIILVRLSPHPRDAYMERLVQTLNDLPEPAGLLFVLDDRHLRARPLP